MTQRKLRGDSKVAKTRVGFCRSLSGAVQTPGQARECGANACCKVPLGGGNYDYIGYSMRTNSRRFTAWVAFNASSKRVDWESVAATELFDLTGDDGRDFDFPGYSNNIALSNPVEVKALQDELKTAVDSWY